MPQLIQHIDAISRAKARDVVFVWFPECKLTFDPDRPRCDWETHPARVNIIEWLDANLIAWQCCAHFASEDALRSYDGRIYIDVPFDLADPVYQKVAAYLENPDGTTRIPGARFECLPLSRALRNKHHDVPGFWEKWAEDL